MSDKTEKISLRLIMPNEGDMDLTKQEDGVLIFEPIFYGRECSGPSIIVTGPDGEIRRFRLMLRNDGALHLREGSRG